MAWDSVPWFIGGGAQHSPEVARLLAFAATSGSEGVVGTGDLKVLPLAVPGGSVRVSAGAGLIRNRAAGGASQTYVARNPVEDTVAIAPTGSGAGRSDLIVAQIEDPYMAGEPWQNPANPVVGPYIFSRVISNVPAGTTRLQDVAGYSGRSAITLARVDLPASTGTVTSAMIKDLRKVALPRRDRQLDTAFWNVGTVSVDTTAFKYLGTSANFTVPEWATTAKIVITYSGMCLFAGNTVGWLRGTMNGTEIRATYFDENWGGSNSRTTYMAAGEIAITSAMRGKSYPIILEGKRDSGPGYLQARLGTSVTIDVEFLEAPA